MKRPLIIVAGALALGAAGIWSATTVSPLAAQVAAMETRSFAIENMTCALCPVTVKTAMVGVEGVRSVEVNFNAKTAIVVFDPSVTTAEAVAVASTEAGYPATPKS